MAKSKCFHVLLDKWVLASLEFRTPFISSEDDNDKKDMSETHGDGDRDPHDTIFITQRRNGKHPG